MIALFLQLLSSSGAYPAEYLETFFYNIGYGLPMRQGAEGIRTIVFGSYDRLHRNIGVLFGWFGFAMLLSAILYRKVGGSLAPGCGAHHAC